MAAAKKVRPQKTQTVVDAERVRRAMQSSMFAIRGLTFERLASNLEAFDLGYLRNASLLWQKIRDRDDTIKTVSEKRELDVALLNWEILPVDDSPEAATHKAALEAFYNGAVATHALDQNQRGGVSTLIRQMMHAVGHKYAVHEIVWDPSGPDLTAEFRFTPLHFFENTMGRLRFLETDMATEGVDLEPAGWMVTVGAGLMEASSIAYMFKNLPLKSWLKFCDKFGMPGLHGQTSAAFASDEWNRFRDALANYAEDWALITSEGGKITPIEINASGTAPHKELVDRMDRAISRLWRGADLGTMSQRGSATGSNPQQQESEILAAADAQIVSETLQHYVDRNVIAFRFGAEPKAYFKVQQQVVRDQDLEIKIDAALIGWGVDRSKKDLLERYGRPEPDAGDELATAPATPAQGAPAAPPAPPAEPSALANEARAKGRDAIFKASAAAAQLAARRTVFKPIADRLAQLLLIEDPVAYATAVENLRASSGQLYRAVLTQAPDLAKPAEEAIGTALVSGMAEHAKATKAAAVQK